MENKINVNLGEAELEIMKVIWDANEPVTAAKIGEKVLEKGWKRTTIATFLSRLTDKEFIKCEAVKRTHFYSPIVSKKDYKKNQLKNLITNLFDGSSKNLVASLFEAKEISDSEIEELKSIFNSSDNSKNEEEKND